MLVSSQARLEGIYRQHGQRVDVAVTEAVSVLGTAEDHFADDTRAA